MPVYDETIDNIVGIINLKDFVFYNGDKNDFVLKDLIREAHVTYEYKNVSELFMEMPPRLTVLSTVWNQNLDKQQLWLLPEGCHVLWFPCAGIKLFMMRRFC